MTGRQLARTRFALLGAAARAAESTTATARVPTTLPLAVSVLVISLTYWCVDIVSPALPTIQQSLSLSATGAGLVFSVFFAGRLVTNLPAAWIAERTGPRWTAVCGAAVLLVGSLCAGIAATEVMLLAARVVQGAGVAILATAGLLSVLRARPGSGAAMTAFNVSSGVGSSAGLLSGGFLATEIGWQAVFWLSALVAALLMLSALLTRATATPRQPTEPVAGDARMGAVSTRYAEAGAVGANLLVYANYAIWIVALPLLGAERFDFNPGQVGLMLLFVNVVHFASALPIGVGIRRIGAMPALAAGFGVVGVGTLLVPLAPDVPWLILPMTLYAIGQVAGNSAAGDLILRLGGGGGRAVGAVRLSSDVGLVVGPAAAGALTDVAGVEAPFVVVGALAIAAMLAAAAARWRR